MRSLRSHTGVRLALAIVLVAVLAIAAPHTAVAQSCSLCYTQAASSSQRFIQALRSGILILMFPPMCLCIAVTLIAYKRRNQFHQR
jgi:uncharacterized membrane protein